MIKVSKTVRGAVDALGLETYLYEAGKTYPTDNVPTSAALEDALVGGGFAEFVKLAETEKPEERVTKVDAPEITKPATPAKRKRRIE